MAVYTDVSVDALQDFLESYEIGALLSCKGIAEGVENSNFLLQTQTGTYILTLYEKRVREKDLPFFLGLMQHLAKKGVACPQPVKRKDGALVGHLSGRPAAIITFLQGMWIRNPAVIHCRGVGEILAKFHLAGSDFASTRKNSLSISGWRSLWQKSCGRTDGFFADMAIDMDRELDRLERDWPEHLPAGVIHADLFPDNVFFLGDTVSGVIDFYFACTDFYAYDLAICLNAWCFEKDFSFNLTKSRAMLEAYCRGRALEANEVSALPVLLRGAAMRFLLTRLYDWLYGPDSGLVNKKDPGEYVRKYQFFRQIERPSELGLSV